MPAPSDILQFMRGQLFQTPQLPHDGIFRGKTVVVTGANTGLGFECARHLWVDRKTLQSDAELIFPTRAQMNVSNLILGCRSIQKGATAREKILSTTKTRDGKSGTNIMVWELDMANYASVRAFAHKISSDLPRLDALVVNAGISTNEYRVAENLEETLTVNIVSSFLLCFLCLPKLQETARQIQQPAHLIITGSNVHCFADHTQLVHPNDGEIFSTLSDKDHADMSGRYFLSKLIVMLCVREMSQCMLRKGVKDVIFPCPSPGWCKTELFRQDDGGFFGRNLLRLIGRTPEVGARTLTSALAAGQETHGQYLSECQVKSPSVWVRSQEGQEVQRKVWTELVDILEQISPGVTRVLST